jgi:putative toxin-antitoxin system antitoxin component (TIGR02293 family)
MINPDRIADVMGGTQVLGHEISSISDLADAVASGLPKAALRNAVQRVFGNNANTFVYRIVPEATYKRRTRLTPAESERTERLARVIANAEYVWDNTEDAREWLQKPHPELGGRIPIEAAMTELGARQVEDLLAKLFYGLPL